jgi:hypothetical protein
MSDEVKTFEMKTVLCPLFASFPTVRQLFPGLSRHKLEDLVGQGMIRKKKTGPGMSDAVLYRVPDILEYLEN